MKKLFLLIVLVSVFSSCEKPSDCLESTGNIITKEVTVLPFKKIKVYRGIEVVITEGPETKVVIEAGENFIDNIEIMQYGDQLVFKDETSCNWVRAYGTTRILITTPTLEEIYSKTDRNISSNGVLSYDNLNIISFDKDADGEAGAGTGDFHLTLDTENLLIANNNVSRFYLSGQATNADFSFYFGDGRMEAANLSIQNLRVYHRGSNDMTVYPVQKVTGILNSTGNLILMHVPPINTVEVLFYGTIIYP